MTEDTCQWIIRWGTTAESTTRCDKSPSHPLTEGHEGPGLVSFLGQRIRWQSGDRREYTGDWPGYCTKLGNFRPFAGGCTLPSGHNGRCAP